MNYIKQENNTIFILKNATLENILLIRKEIENLLTKQGIDMSLKNLSINMSKVENCDSSLISLVLCLIRLAKKIILQSK